MAVSGMPLPITMRLGWQGQGYELEGLIAAVAASVERGEPLPETILRANI